MTGNNGLTEEQDILAKRRVTVVFDVCGVRKDYEWVEPKRRIKRDILYDVQSIHSGMKPATKEQCELVDGIEEGDWVIPIEQVNKVLDLMYKHHPGMRRDREILDEVDEKQIGVAFASVIDLVRLTFPDAPGAGPKGPGAIDPIPPILPTSST